MSINQRTKFDILPNEILLEIFEYLPPVHIFETFFYLNQRYNTLLLSIRLRIDLFNISKQMFDYYNHFLFPIASQCVISLRCEDVFDRLIHHIHLENFISLEYLTITNIQQSSLKYIIPYIHKFTNLIYLNLQTKNEIGLNELYFEEPMMNIEKCVLNLNKRILIQGNQCYSNLIYLNINQYHIDDLVSFLHLYTPQLEHLTVALNDEYNTKKLLPKTVEKHPLQSLVIKQCRIPFDRIEQLILTSLPYLKRLNINATGVDYADGRQWERLISTSLPCLMKFELQTTFPTEDVPTAIHRTQLLKTFESTYYLTHHWHFALISHPSNPTIDFFSLPLMNSKIHAHLYDTQIEKTINEMNVFDNVTELSLVLSSSNSYSKLPNLSFPNVKKLKLISRFHQYETLPRMMIVDVAQLVPMWKLESIELIGNHFPSSTLILLEYTTKLQSLSLSFNHLIQMTKTLTDQRLCQRLTMLIKHLTITSINNLNNLPIFERLPIIFSHLNSLSLSLVNPTDLYPLIILIVPKVAKILKRMVLSIETHGYGEIVLNEFMAWLIGYMHSHDLEKVDVKHQNSQVYFCF